MIKFLVVLAVQLACISAIPVEHASSYASVQHHDLHHVAPVHHEVVYPDHHPKYEFKYGVEDNHTGDHKSQSEVRDGDVVKGEYSVVQPDGTIRNVHYSADHHNGFNAQVSYSGHAVYPQEVIHKTDIGAPVYHH